jgi:DNA-binding TFAR19-related protein (PDSD5 family)
LTKDQAEALAEYMKQLMQIGNVDGYARAGQLADLIQQTDEENRDKTLQIFEPVFNGDELDVDNPSPDLDL